MRKFLPILLVIVLVLLIGDSNAPAGSQLRAGLPYKVYVALLNQSGEDAPVATVSQNTLGGNVEWSWVSTGNYRATLTGAFTSGKTVIFITPDPSSAKGNYHALLPSFSGSSLPDTLMFTCGNVANEPADNLVTNDSIEIRVYP
jgi:hypothetical protein